MMSFLELFLDLFGSSSLVGCGNQQQLRMSKRYDVSCEILGRESGKPRPQLQAILKSMRCFVVELASSHVNDLFLHVLHVNLSEKAWENGAWLLSCLSLFDLFWSLDATVLLGSLQQISLPESRTCCSTKNLRRPDGWKHGCRTVTHTITCTRCCLQVPTHVSSLSVSLSASLWLSVFFSDIGPIGLSKRFNMYLYSIDWYEYEIGKTW